MSHQTVTLDGNEAAAIIAHKTSEVIAIYPITPASAMGEFADEWTAKGRQNIWGSVPRVIEMQSEGGAAGAVHGALQAGSLTTTFTASQGLLLMIPNMYKIAGELTSTVFHIAARSLAAQALSIFGDHSDVMAARATGWAMLFGASVQEAHDFAMIALTATLESRVPFLHIMDGFRTSHEINKIELLADKDIEAMLPADRINEHRARALSPDHPVIRGTAQNPDVYFQAREAANLYYERIPGIVQKVMDDFGGRTGRTYHLFDYFGAVDAERVIVLMGSGAQAVEETVEHLLKHDEKVGVIKVRLFRPFSVEDFMAALPLSVQTIAVLDRTKEPGSAGEPLYQDVSTALIEAISGGTSPFKQTPRIIGGRYGLSSKEFTPAMVKAVFDEMTKDHPKNHFTVGIHDDVSHTSLDYDPAFTVEAEDVVKAVFWGLGADGTVGANKNSIKIIGEGTSNYAQGYFVIDSRKSGSKTVSHLRFGPRPIKSAYLIDRANFVACHQFDFLERYDVLGAAAEGATFLLNSPYSAEAVWDVLPRHAQQAIIDKHLKFYAIDAYRLARELGLGIRINTIMQVAFFALSEVLPPEEAVKKIKAAIVKSYGKRGEAVVEQNFAAVEAALDHLEAVSVPEIATSSIETPPTVPLRAPEFVREVTAEIIAGRGDLLPVSALPVDGTYPVGTTQWEKRNIALEVPVWDTELCIQCGKCVLVCPHAVIRAKAYDAAELDHAPETFKSANARWKELPDLKYSLQVSVEDCTGCQLCVEVCPVVDKANPDRKAINMAPQRPLREAERLNWDFFLTLPDMPRVDSLNWTTVKNTQLLHPLFEFSGACMGCGETPYLILLSRLFGDRALIANATGCSSIYGGNLPAHPWTANAEGRGPAWSNSLFEDNAEFGLGMRISLDKQIEYARELVYRLAPVMGEDLAQSLLAADQSTEAGIAAQRIRVKQLKNMLDGLHVPFARDVLQLADVLVRKSVWIVGGDGWAYDIGFGGLDHVLASGQNVKLLVLDTEVYSNTGGQASKATPLGAVAKFAAGGKPTPKKDLGAMAMAYGNVFVAQIAFGAQDSQTVKAFLEAEAYPGPAILIAYGHCIAHGIDMEKGLDHQKLAVETGYWPLYRYDPTREAEGKAPFQLDSKPPHRPLHDYFESEARYQVLAQTKPDVAARLAEEAQAHVKARWHHLEELAHRAPAADVG